MYDPSPRDFTLSISQYMHNQQQELNEVFTDERKMRLFAGFLDQAASRWYSSLVNEREQAAQRAQPYLVLQTTHYLLSIHFSFSFSSTRDPGTLSRLPTI